MRYRICINTQRSVKGQNEVYFQFDEASGNLLRKRHSGWIAAFLFTPGFAAGNRRGADHDYCHDAVFSLRVV